MALLTDTNFIPNSLRGVCTYRTALHGNCLCCMELEILAKADPDNHEKYIQIFNRKCWTKKVDNVKHQVEKIASLWIGIKCLYIKLKAVNMNSFHYSCYCFLKHIQLYSSTLFDFPGDLFNINHSTHLRPRITRSGNLSGETACDCTKNSSASFGVELGWLISFGFKTWTSLSHLYAL